MNARHALNPISFPSKNKKGGRVQHLATNVFFKKVMARRRDEKDLHSASLVEVVHFTFTPI